MNAWLPMVGKPEDDYTPLAVAAWEGHADIVRALLEAAADPRRTVELFSGAALHETSYFGHVETVRVLTEPRDAGVAPSTELDAQGALNGMTPLHDAVWHGHVEACRALVEAAHPLHLRTHAGLTAHQQAIQYGYGEIGRYLGEAEDALR